jgi:hypothetical protein
MLKRSFAVMLSALALTAVMGNTAPKAAVAGDSCTALPGDAVTALPAPLRKWGKIECTPIGQVLSSRKNWIWAQLDGQGMVLIPSQMVSQPVAGEEAYFTSISVRDLAPEEFASAFPSFDEGLPLDEEAAHGYRVDISTVSGRSTTIYFFDFPTFAGGIWCPDDNCVPESRFLIVEKDHSKNDLSKSI